MSAPPARLKPQRMPQKRGGGTHMAGRLDPLDAAKLPADVIITVRSLIRQAWTTYRWDARPAHRR